MSAPAVPATEPAALRRVLSNVAALLGAYVFPRLFTAASVVVAARVLGPDGFGAYGTAAAFAVILSILATLGMMPLLVRELARAPERAPGLLRAAHVVKAGSALIMLAALIGIAVFALAYPSTVVAAAFLLGLGYAVGSFAENLGAWFQAIERMHVWMQANALFGLVTGVLGAWLVWSTGSVVWFCAAPLAGQVAALLWLLGRAPPSLRRPGALAPGAVSRLSRALVPFALAFVALTLFYKVDVLLLTRWRAAAEVGIYVAAYKFVDVIHALTLAGVAAVYPRLARRAPAALALRTTHPGGVHGGRSRKPARSERWTATRVSELLLVASVPGAGLLWLLRGELVGMLYGAGFGGSAAVLAALAPAVPALALNLLAGYVLAATGHMRLVALGYAGALLLKVGLNAVLIPAHGTVGAGAAMLLSELALAAGFLAALRLVAGAAPEGRTLRAAGGAAVAWGILALLSLLLPGSGGPVAAALYGSVVLVLYWREKVVEPREWRILADALRGGTLPQQGRGP